MTWFSPVFLSFLGSRIKISILSVDIKYPNICYFPFYWSLEHKIKWTLDGSMPDFYLYKLRNKPGILMMKNGQLVIFLPNFNKV